jgi:phosphoglycerate dehydrogenase-like enzyme
MLAGGSANGSDGWFDLRGKTVGLIGWGHIARRFTELLSPFDCELLVHSEFASSEELAQFGARPASLGELLGSSNVISLHRGLTDRTRNFLDRQRLALVRKGSVLVNTARGGLIDEEALIERARRGDIVLALDVFHQEPLPRRHPLRRMSNVILTPHNAGTTPACNQRVGKQALDAVEQWLSKRTAPTVETGRLATIT